MRNLLWQAQVGLNIVLPMGTILLMKSVIEKTWQWLKSEGRAQDLLVALLIAAVSVFFCSTSTSPLFPAMNIDIINLDSNLFQYQGYLLLQGKTPYLDFYDHKGIYHLAVCALGYSMGGRYGLFFLQIVHSWFSLFFILRSVRLLSERKTTYLIAVGLFFGFWMVFRTGVAIGELLMPFISLMQWSYITAIKKGNSRMFLLGSFLAGLQISLAANSRLTDALWGCTILIFYLTYYFRHKGETSFWANAGLALIGFLVPNLIIMPIAYVNGYLLLMIKAAIIDNILYVGEAQFDADRIFSIALLIIAAAMLVVSYIFEDREKPNNGLNLFFVMNGLIAVAGYFAFAHYIHYFWISVPFIISSTAHLFGTVLEKKTYQKAVAYSMLGFLSFAALTFQITLPSLYYTSGIATFSYHDSKKIETDVLSIPEEYRKTKNAVYAINCDNGVYLIGGMDPDTPYRSNQTWWSTSNPDVVEAVNEYLEGETPTFLLLGKRWQEQAYEQFPLLTSLYEKWESPTFGNPHFDLLYIPSEL